MNRNKWLLVALALIVLIVVAVLVVRPSADEPVGEQNDAPIVDQVGDADDEGSEEDAQNEEDQNEDVALEVRSIAEVYKDYFPIGAAIEPHQTEGQIAELLKEHVNMIVAENAMKPEGMQPREGQFNWGPADRIVNFAKENDMEVRFHTLVWHTQVPGWFFIDEDGNRMVDETDPEKREANKALLLERLETHVKTIVERYKDDIKSWDVVNEVVEPADPDGMRNSEWYQITGTDYIETAFRAAREAGGPDIKLYINDYNTEQSQKRDILYNLVKDMLDRGVPIDGVGHQTHISVAYPPAHQIISSMEKFAELGLDNIVTELDMSIYAWDDRSDYGVDTPEEVLNKQAERYREIFRAFKNNNHLLSEVVFWGISDSHTWLHTFPVNSRTDAPLPFDKNFEPKPAYWGIIDEPLP